MEKHFCTSVYVFNLNNRKFLLVNHKKLGKWLQPGGHIEPNEDPEEAAIREVFEETGFNVELAGTRLPRKSDFITPLGIQRNEVKAGHIHIDFIYAATVKSGKKTLNSAESNGIKWFSLEEIEDPSFNTFDDLRFWCKYIANDIFA
jgi:8-oxo-dGTP pyrophosphatase MutT (NUDIX family)